MQRLYTDILKRKKNFLRKDAPKRANFEQLAYGEKQQSIRKQPSKKSSQLAAALF
jgi:hypothetical protein